jgi:hypothetical protein
VLLTYGTDKPANSDVTLTGNTKTRLRKTSPQDIADMFRSMSKEGTFTPIPNSEMTHFDPYSDAKRYDGVFRYDWDQRRATMQTARQMAYEKWLNEHQTATQAEKRTAMAAEQRLTRIPTGSLPATTVGRWTTRALDPTQKPPRWAAGPDKIPPYRPPEPSANTPPDTAPPSDSHSGENTIEDTSHRMGSE